MTRLTDEIVERFREGFARAEASGLPEPTAMTLATADGRGRPAARTVLLKDMDAGGFVFFTNTNSRKGRHLAENANASLVFWWREIEEQVLVDGRAEPVSAAEADAYFRTRPRGSQIGAWASDQSAPLADRKELVDRVAEIEARFEGRDIPCPPHWSGYRVSPRRIEFWYGRDYRLHERVCYTLTEAGWQRSLLYP